MKETYSNKIKNYLKTRVFKYAFLVFKGVAHISTSDKDMTLSEIFDLLLILYLAGITISIQCSGFKIFCI